MRMVQIYPPNFESIGLVIRWGMRSARSSSVSLNISLFNSVGTGSPCCSATELWPKFFAGASIKQ